MAERSEDRPLLSHWRRLAGMLFEPRRVMEDLARQPRWLFPVVLSLVPPVVLFFLALFRTARWLDLGSLGRDFLGLLAAIGFGFAAGVFMLLVSALVLVGLMRALSCTLRIRSSLALVSYSSVPSILISSALAVFRAGVVLLQLDSPIPPWFWLTLAAFLDQSASHPVVLSIAQEVGVYSLWRWLLVALGLTIMERSVSFRVAFGAAVVALVLVESISNLATITVVRLIQSRML